MRQLLFAVVFLVAVPALALTPTPTTTPATGSCCNEGGNVGPGCENASCQNCVCNCDPFCCTTQYDTQCAEEAQGIAHFCPANSCDAQCVCDATPTATPTGLTPTITQTATITPTPTGTPTGTPQTATPTHPWDEEFFGPTPQGTTTPFATATVTGTATPTRTATGTASPTTTSTKTPNAALTGCCECPGCCGDVDASGQVSQADVNACQAAFSAGDYWKGTACDCDGNGIISAQDLTKVIDNFHLQNCAPLTQCAVPPCQQGCILVNGASCQVKPTPTVHP